MNVGETVVYDAVKDYLVGQGRMKEGVPAHLSRCNDDIQKPPFVQQLKMSGFSVPWWPGLALPWWPALWTS